MSNDPSFDAPKKSNTLWYVLGGIFGGVFLLCCLPCGGFTGYGLYINSQNEKRVESEAGITITAEDLAKNYSDAAYKDKVVVVTGKVGLKSLLGVEFGTTPKVTCQPASTEGQAFEGIKTGDTVTLKGICVGKLGDDVLVQTCHKK